MAGFSRCAFWRLVVVGGCLVSVMALATGSVPADNLTGLRGNNTHTSLRVLQMNLCNSGIAGCYTGRSVAEAAALIRAERADIVTLNEVCRNDVSVLERAMSDATSGNVVASAFEAAVDRRTGNAVRCRNGQPYGVGLLARIPSPYRGYTTSAARYSMQATTDPEERVWLCVHAIAHFVACATHLASTSPPVAFSQCRDLLNKIIPAARALDGTDPVILGADLNLKRGVTPDVRSCVPPGFARTDDGGTQDIVASNDLTPTSSGTIGMHGTTDHPGLLADLTGSDGFG